jgi:outer membrane receptor protein involved in Fe transport
MSEIFSANSGVQPDGTLFEPNVSDSDEIGIKLDLLDGKVSALANAYRRRELNRIILHSDPALASLGFRQQVPGDELTGYELDLFVTPIPELQVNLSYTYMNVDNLGGLYTRSLPEVQYSVLGRYEFSRGRLKNLALGLGYLSYDERPGDTANSFYLEAYDVLDGFVSYRRGQYRFQLNLFNLMDADDEYTSVNRNIVSTLPARRFMFRISREF